MRNYTKEHLKQQRQEAMLDRLVTAIIILLIILLLAFMQASDRAATDRATTTEQQPTEQRQSSDCLDSNSQRQDDNSYLLSV